MDQSFFNSCLEFSCSAMRRMPHGHRRDIQPFQGLLRLPPDCQHQLGIEQPDHFSEHRQKALQLLPAGRPVR